MTSGQCLDAILAAVTHTQHSVATIERSQQRLQERLQHMEQSRVDPAPVTGVDTNEDGRIDSFAVDTTGDGQIDTIVPLMGSAPTLEEISAPTPKPKVRFDDGSEIETTREVTQEA